MSYEGAVFPSDGICSIPLIDYATTLKIELCEVEDLAEIPGVAAELDLDTLHYLMEA